MKTCYPLFRAERPVNPHDAAHIGGAVQRLLRSNSATTAYSASRPAGLHLSLFNAGDYNGVLRSAANNEQALIHNIPASAHRSALDRGIDKIRGSRDATRARVVGVTAVGENKRKLVLLVRSERFKQLDKEYWHAANMLRRLGGLAIEPPENAKKPLLHVTVAEAVGEAVSELSSDKANVEHDPDVLEGLLELIDQLPVLRLEPVNLIEVQPRRPVMAESAI